MKQISIFANEQELADFKLIKEKLNRKTDSDTIRVMIRLVKKNLLKNISIATIKTRG